MCCHAFAPIVFLSLIRCHCCSSGTRVSRQATFRPMGSNKVFWARHGQQIVARVKNNPNGMSQLCDWKCLFVASNVYGCPRGRRSGVDFILLKISGTCMFFWRWRMSFQQRRQRTHSQVARDKWSPRPDRCLCSRAFCRCVPEGTLLPECFLWNVEV